MEKEKITTKDVLKVIAVGSIVVASVITPTLPMAVGMAVKQWKNIKKRELGIIIRRLEKQEMISCREEKDKTIIEITEKGKRRLLEYDFANLQLKNKKRDGKWRLIIFDIPEGKKRNREAFRQKLVELGCKWVQDSVFACAFPCKSEIDFICHFLEISDYVTVVSLHEFERGEKLLFKKQSFDE